MTTQWAFSLAFSSYMVAGNSFRTGTLLLTACSISTRVTFFLACGAPVAGFTHTGAMTPMTLQRILLDTATLLRAACAKGPLGTREVAEASVESGIAEAGAVRPMAASVVGTVALLVALLPVETLRTAVLAQVSTDPWWTAAAPGDRITARTVLALAVERAVFAEKSLRARLVADDASPAVVTITAAFPLVALASV